MTHPELKPIVYQLLQKVSLKESQQIEMSIINELPIRALKSFLNMKPEIIESLITTLNQLLM